MDSVWEVVMASERLTAAVAQIITGEDGDAAFARLFGDQCKPCDFRRWYSQVRNTGTCEMGEEMTAKLKTYIDEGIDIDDAFKDYVPDYVGPGEFGTAYTKEIRARKAAAAAAAGGPAVIQPVVAQVSRRRRVREQPTAEVVAAETAVVEAPVVEVPVVEVPVVEG